jgi:hypothetical protein
MANRRGNSYWSQGSPDILPDGEASISLGLP